MSSPFFTSVLAKALEREWDDAVLRLPSSQRALMHRPLFSVSRELPGRWGQWRGGRSQCIELNERLVLEHPWYAVVDVVRHEMAHQLVEALYPGLDEAPHGPRFLSACRALGARPQASGDYPTLDQVVYREEEDSPGASEGARTPQSRLLVKIRKLLSLSKSPNEEEARSALLKARELEARYQEAYGELQEEGAEGMDYYTVLLGCPLPRMEIRESTLAGILQEFYHVRAIWENVPDLESPRPGALRHQLSICGARKDLRIATYVYDCLRSYMKQALYQLPPLMLGQALSRARVRRDFELGVLDGFRQALREQNQRPEMRALVQWDRTHLEEYCRWVYPRLRSHHHTSTMLSREHRAAGEAAGRRFRLKEGLESPGAARKALK